MITSASGYVASYNMMPVRPVIMSPSLKQCASVGEADAFLSSLHESGF